MHLRFGPLRLHLHGSRRWLDLARLRYDTFVDAARDDAVSPSADFGVDFGVDISVDVGIDVEVEYEAEGDGPTPRQLGESLLRPLQMSPAGSGTGSGAWHLEAPGIHGSLNKKSIRLRGPLATFPLDSAMIALWSLACGPDAVLVHGALLADGDRGWLCTGPSGVGKSTLAELLPRRALCDELTGVRLESGELVAYGLPFWRGRPGRVHLQGVHFLAHGAEHERRELDPARAFARIQSQILWPSWCETSLSGAFRVAASLAELPVDVLSFRPEPDVWRHLAVRRPADAPTHSPASVSARAS